jgi:hypothetical protein
MTELLEGALLSKLVWGLWSVIATTSIEVALQGLVGVWDVFFSMT